jgi:DnaJ-class molecular chaperone
MAHAEKCPVCNGTGNKNGAEDNLYGTNIICRGCGGSGWVEVQDRNEYYETTSIVQYSHGYLGGAFLDNCNCEQCLEMKRIA